MAWPATSTTKANLNLRASPTTASSVLTVMPNGGTIQITGAPQNGWYPVTYNGQSGWAAAQYVNPPAPTTGSTPPPATAPSPYGTSTTNTQGANLNLRSSGSLSASIIGKIPDKSQITITGAAVNGWYPVTYQGKSGFVSAQYVNPFTPSTPSDPSTPTTPPPSTSPAPPPPPQSPAPGQPQNPFYDPGSTYGGNQNWYETPLIKQDQDFDAEWEKTITDQGFGGFGAKANVARNLIDRAKTGFNAATMNNPNLDPRSYINDTLGPNFLRNAMASMTPIQKGEMPGIYQTRSRWVDR